MRRVFSRSFHRAIARPTPHRRTAPARDTTKRRIRDLIICTREFARVEPDQTRRLETDRAAPRLSHPPSQQDLSSFGGGARRQQARVAHGREGARASAPGGGRGCPRQAPAPQGRSAPAHPVFDPKDRAGALFHEEEPGAAAAIGAVHHARGRTRGCAPRRARAPGGTGRRGSASAAADHDRRSLRVAQHG